jgi:hypothetical protein
MDQFNEAQDKLEKNIGGLMQKKFCRVCGCPLHTEEELQEPYWCTKHLDEFDRRAGW